MSLSPRQLSAPLALFAGLLLGPATSVGEDRAAQQKALAPFQSFVGEWRGTGQVRRGSTQGAWTEETQWAWKYDEHSAALVLSSSDGKHLREARLSTGEKTTLVLAATNGDKQTGNYRGGLDTDGKLVLALDKVGETSLPDRVSLKLVAGGDRMVMLLERATAEKDRFTQIGEVGYTRKGSGFGQGSNFPECVVTGGRGTIQVTHDGKTYFVCCSGCRDLFNDDPAGVLKEYRERKAKEQAQKKK